MSQLNRLTMAAVASTALAAVTACSEPEQLPPPKPRPVVTVTVGEPQAYVDRSFSGLLKPSQGVDLSFEVSGRIIDLPAKRGVRYTAGEVLARLDSSDYQSQLTGAQAELTEADQAKNRTKALFEAKNASKSEMEAAIARASAARTKFESAKKKVDDCTLAMPYDGIVSSVIADTQAVVTAGQAVISLQGDGNMEFVIGIPAAEVGKITLGMTSTITLGSLPGLTLSAKISEIASQPEDNTTYPVEFVVEGQLDPAVRAGMDGEATLSLPNHAGPAIQIPVECVIGRGEGDQPYVWILEGEGNTRTVAKREVTIGNLTPGGNIEIGDGLTPGELVVSRGVHQLEAGNTVSVADQN